MAQNLEYIYYFRRFLIIAPPCWYSCQTEPTTHAPALKRPLFWKRLLESFIACQCCYYYHMNNLHLTDHLLMDDSDFFDLFSNTYLQKTSSLGEDIPVNNLSGNSSRVRGLYCPSTNTFYIIEEASSPLQMQPDFCDMFSDQVFELPKEEEVKIGEEIFCDNAYQRR